MDSLQSVALYTAFEDHRRIASGSLAEVAIAVQQAVAQQNHGSVLVFDNETSETVEVDVNGTAGHVRERYAGSQTPPQEKRGPGRPKLGVIGREVTLLPRHWEWLDGQPGGASVALRRLVEEARRSNAGKDRLRRAQDAVYRFMSAMAGDLPGFEEALRAFYAKQYGRLPELVERWPDGIREHLKSLISKAEAFENI